MVAGGVRWLSYRRATGAEGMLGAAWGGREREQVMGIVHRWLVMPFEIRMHAHVYIPHFLELFPPLHHSHTGHLALVNEINPPLNSPGTMCVRDYLGGHGSTFNCLISQVVPERAAY